MAKCKTAEWRGNTVCAHWVPYLDQFAKETGDFVVTPIPGFGSYENNPTSAGTDEGGGHCDFYMTRIPSTTSRKKIEDLSRKILGMGYDRKRLVKNGKVYWTDHLHVMDPRCPNLSSAGAGQFTRYFDGRNNLASGGPDTGTRQYVDRHKSLFVNRKTNAASGKYPPIVAPPLPPKPEVPPMTEADRQPDIKDPTAHQIWYWDGIIAHDTATSKNKFWSAASHLTEIMRAVVAIRADVAAIKKKVGA
jgi:hypothetical protein